MFRGIKSEVRWNRTFLLIIIANQYRMGGQPRLGLTFLLLAIIMAVTAFLSRDDV